MLPIFATSIGFLYLSPSILRREDRAPLDPASDLLFDYLRQEEHQSKPTPEHLSPKDRVDRGSPGVFAPCYLEDLQHLRTRASRHSLPLPSPCLRSGPSCTIHVYRWREQRHRGASCPVCSCSGGILGVGRHRVGVRLRDSVDGRRKDGHTRRSSLQSA